MQSGIGGYGHSAHNIARLSPVYGRRKKLNSARCADNLHACQRACSDSTGLDLYGRVGNESKSRFISMPNVNIFVLSGNPGSPMDARTRRFQVYCSDRARTNESKLAGIRFDDRTRGSMLTKWNGRFLEKWDCCSVQAPCEARGGFTYGRRLLARQSDHWNDPSLLGLHRAEATRACFVMPGCLHSADCIG